MEKRRICLYNLEQAALIILEPSGIMYFNQTMGNTCFQAEAEGILAPVTNDPPLDNLYFGSLTYKLRELTENKPYLDELDAVAIEELLKINISWDKILVDKGKLKDSHEAWIFVKIDEQTQGDLKDFAGCNAILTYPNSD